MLMLQQGEQGGTDLPRNNWLPMQKLGVRLLCCLWPVCNKNCYLPSAGSWNKLLSLVLILEQHSPEFQFIADDMCMMNVQERVRFFMVGCRIACWGMFKTFNNFDCIKANCSYFTNASNLKNTYNSLSNSLHCQTVCLHSCAISQITIEIPLFEQWIDDASLQVLNMIGVDWLIAELWFGMITLSHQSVFLKVEDIDECFPSQAAVQYFELAHGGRLCNQFNVILFFKYISAMCIFL